MRTIDTIEIKEEYKVEETINRIRGKVSSSSTLASPRLVAFCQTSLTTTNYLVVGAVPRATVISGHGSRPISVDADNATPFSNLKGNPCARSNSVTSCHFVSAPYLAFTTITDSWTLSTGTIFSS